MGVGPVLNHVIKRALASQLQPFSEFLLLSLLRLASPPSEFHNNVLHNVVELESRPCHAGFDLAGQLLEEVPNLEFARQEIIQLQ